MKTKKNTGRIMLIIAAVLTLLTLVFSIIGAVALGFNVGGVTDVVSKILLDAGYPATEIDSEITMMTFSLVFESLIELYFAIFYIKAIKFRASSVSFARRLMSKSIWQFVCGSFLPAIFAMIAAMNMGRQKENIRVVPVNEFSNVDENKIPDYKLTAMSEAVARLKELRKQGSISEEEYYANLNRILEG